MKTTLPRRVPRQSAATVDPAHYRALLDASPTTTPAAESPNEPCLSPMSPSARAERIAADALLRQALFADYPDQLLRLAAGWVPAGLSRMHPATIGHVVTTASRLAQRVTPEADRRYLELTLSPLPEQAGTVAADVPPAIQPSGTYIEFTW